MLTRDKVEVDVLLVNTGNQESWPFREKSLGSAGSVSTNGVN